MNFLILGTGGIGAFYGARLLSSSNKVTFVARSLHLEAIRKNGLQVQHPDFSFSQKVDVSQLQDIDFTSLNIDVIILTTKSNTTRIIAKELSFKLDTLKDKPYILSLQNGVENEKILCEYFKKDKIIGGLTRKIGAHIIKPSFIEATGKVETLIGSISQTKENTAFLKKLNKSINEAGILCEVVDDINKELWKKLIINNGVNAICALLKIKTGVLMNNEKLSSLVYGLMKETQSAAKACSIEITNNELSQMYELIKNFDSIKPSMLVDREFKRELEIDEICNVVINYNKMQNIDSPYTKSISYLLDFVYKNEK
ncbi:ketopantoate reductase family protein [Arcobacter roscoffensis]|uniref:2-dehydropantoate 2-reductase n=1 Tax=Arcobacter roscoffensis TaxID=2961520 RepID=A0ABY5E7U4_9BACT|nr:ketopantoate reductase family protein [Arcobacter roscoffensis]UTJ06821.1 ketopantoate reductase family protein [Arcobacter roscoffensis]